MRKIVTDEKQDLNDKSSVTPLIKVRKNMKRWIALFIFSLNTTALGALFIGISPITSIGAKYYKVNDVMIQWTSNIFIVVFIIFALPASYTVYKFGIRLVLFSVTVLNILATGLHYVGYRQDKFYFVIIGQIFSAVGNSAVFQMPGRLSSLWFDVNERGIATAIGFFMNIVGVAIGFLQCTLMIRDSPDYKVLGENFRLFYLSQLVICIFIMLLTFIFFKDAPLTSSCSSSIINEPFFRCVIKLLSSKHFVLMSQAYAICFGLMTAYGVLLSTLMTRKFHGNVTDIVGWMGFANNVFGIFGGLIVGIIMDKIKKIYCMAVFLNFSSTILLLAFIIILEKTSNLYGVFIMFTVYGVFGFPYLSLGLEQAAEITYPAPETTSSAFILILGNVYGLCFSSTFGYLIQCDKIEVVYYTSVGLNVLATVFTFVSKTKMRRSLIESFKGDEHFYEILKV